MYFKLLIYGRRNIEYIYIFFKLLIYGRINRSQNMQRKWDRYPT
jgi:hypothetical protein